MANRKNDGNATSEDMLPDLGVGPEPTSNRKTESEVQQLNFSMIDTDLDELGKAETPVEASFGRKITPSATRTVVFMFLEKLIKMILHVQWLDSGPEFFGCGGSDCALCLISDKAKPHLVGRIYEVDEDRSATLVLSLCDTSKTKNLAAVKELKATFNSLGADQIFRTPFELLKEDSRVGVQHVIVRPEKTSTDSIFTFDAHDPEAIAAQAQRANLTEDIALRPFSLDLDGALLPKVADKVRRKLGLPRSR